MALKSIDNGVDASEIRLSPQRADCLEWLAAGAGAKSASSRSVFVELQNVTT